MGRFMFGWVLGACFAGFLMVGINDPAGFIFAGIAGVVTVLVAAIRAVAEWSDE